MDERGEQHSILARKAVSIIPHDTFLNCPVAVYIIERLFPPTNIAVASQPSEQLQSLLATANMALAKYGFFVETFSNKQRVEIYHRLQDTSVNIKDKRLYYTLKLKEIVVDMKNIAEKNKELEGGLGEIGGAFGRD